MYSGRPVIDTVTAFRVVQNSDTELISDTAE
jgi:hypothetical protein